MIAWQPHRNWLAILAAAFVIGVGGTPLLAFTQQKTAAKLAAIQNENTQTANALQQLQNDIADAEKMKDQMSIEEAEKNLAPIDRLRAAQILEHRAQEAHLSNFSYTLSPEEKVAIDTIGAGKQDLANSKITLTADAPTDSDAYIFLETIARTLPGRLTLRHITLQRIGANDTPLTAKNIHLTADAEWLSNGAAQNLAEGTQ